MSSKRVIELEGSGEQDATESDDAVVVDVRGAEWQATCPECGGRVRKPDHESVCADCGLVVSIETLDRTPTLVDHAPDNDSRNGEWSCEPTNELRVDKGLHTTFFLNTDGKGNKLSSERKDRMERLRQRHKRFTMHDKRDQRLNEGMKDIGMLGANLALPEHVQTDAGRYLKQAKRERLPGGRMPWEGLAAGAVLLAARKHGIERSPDDVARYAKASLDRVCAGARKVRLETNVDAPPVRDRAVDRVVAALDDVLDVEAAIELVRVGERLLEVADSEAIGSGTHRIAMAGAAVYAADRLTSGKHLTQAEVIEAASTVVPTSQYQIRNYSREVHDIGQARFAGKPDDAVTGLVQAD